MPETQTNKQTISFVKIQVVSYISYLKVPYIYIYIYIYDILRYTVYYLYKLRVLSIGDRPYISKSTMLGYCQFLAYAIEDTKV